MANVNVGVIGYGYWGPNIVRNFFAASNCTVKKVADARPERLAQLAKIFPTIQGVTDADDIINDKEIDAVIIATPVFSHYPLAKQALENGKHVLIEKPMTSTVAEAESLIEIADRKGLVLMVDHTFLYTGAVKKMKELVNTDQLGNLNYYDSTRINLGLFQPDVNVVWDLVPHDISILYYLTNERPVSVSATGVDHLRNGIENIAYVTLNFQSNMIAHFTCSWSSPVKIRKILVGGDQKMILFDDLEITEKVKVYDTGYSARTDEEKRKLLIDYRTGDVHIPKLEMKEALAGIACDFVSSIQTGKEPVSNWKIGSDVVKVLEAAQRSIKQNGKEIKIIADYERVK